MTASGENVLPHHQSQTQRKRAAILQAATNIFLNAGYAGASMDAITREAGVSKATVYSHFADKEALFGAIIEARCQELVGPLVTSSMRAGEAKDILRAVAGNFMKLIMSETALALYRVVIAEAPRFPELARVFYENGPARAIRGVADYLSEQAKLGRLEISDPTMAAEQFFSLLTGYLHVRAILGIDPPPDEAGMSAHIDNTVRTFLRAYGCGRQEEIHPEREARGTKARSPKGRRGH